MSIFTIVFAFLAFSGIIIAMQAVTADRKSTRLNSSHSQISYAVFCLKKKKNKKLYKIKQFQKINYTCKSCTTLSISRHTSQGDAHTDKQDDAYMLLRCQLINEIIVSH